MYPPPFSPHSSPLKIQIHTYFLTLSSTLTFGYILCHLDYVVRHCYKPLWISVSPAYLYFTPYFIVSVFYRPYKQVDNKNKILTEITIYSSITARKMSHLLSDTHLQPIYNSWI